MTELILPIRRRGALVKMLVRTAGKQPLGPFQAYLDTGASDSMLDFGVISSMSLQPVRIAALNVLGRAEVSFHETYDVEVALVVSDQSPRWVPLTALGGSVYPTGGVAALGRDFLNHVVFTYDGPNSRAVVRW